MLLEALGDVGRAAGQIDRELAGLLLGALNALLYLAHRVRGRLWTLPLGVLLWGWVAYTIALGVVPPLALLGWIDVAAFGFQFFNTWSVPVWIALLVVSYLLRGIMIQFAAIPVNDGGFAPKPPPRAIREK